MQILLNSQYWKIVRLPDGTVRAGSPKLIYKEFKPGSEKANAFIDFAANNPEPADDESEEFDHWEEKLCSLF